MGKDWDKALPSIDIWKECVRVLKPGGFAFIMSAPRSDVHSRMCLMLEEAGFRIDFTPIAWTYATGFPKASNIGKMVDKRLGKERKVVGKRSDGMSSTAMKPDKGWNDNKMGPDLDITEPKSDKAKELDGSYAGFQPKPAWENVIVCMKPLSEKGYLDQAMKDGKGVTWLDDCRVPFKGESDLNSATFGTQTDIRNNNFGTNRPSDGYVHNTNVEANPQGRFPANLLVQDDVLNDGKLHEGKTGFKATASSIYVNKNCTKKTTDSGKAEFGTFSRYYDLDAWWEERIQELSLIHI